MNFDRSKVLDAFSEDLEKYIGYKGFFSDNLWNLKGVVHCNNERSKRVLEKIVDNKLQPFCSEGVHWQFFYPVEPPKEKAEKNLVPFDTCQELIDWFRRRVGIKASNIAEPIIWVKKIGYDERHIITDFNEEHQNCVVGGLVFKMHDLSTNFTLLDGTPIGKRG